MSKLSQLKQDAHQAGKKRNWAEAIALYEEILERDKNNPTVINELGDLCLRASDMAQAIRHFLNAAAKYRQTGLLNNAVAIYKKVLRYDAENQNAHWYLAETRAGQGLTVEGEEHARQFLRHAGRVSGEIKEIFHKRCTQLLELLPDSADVQATLVQTFRLWGMNLEASRAQCLLGAGLQDRGQADEARALINEALARSPEVENYPEYARWDMKANPGAARSSGHFTGFGTVTLDSAPLAAEPVAPPSTPSMSDIFGNIDIGGNALAHEDSGNAVRRVTDILAQGDPAKENKDPDGCFDIEGGEDLEALVQEAIGKSRLHRAPSAPVPGPDEAAAWRDAKGDDPLSRFLNAESVDTTGSDSSQLTTITSEIGAVVGSSGGESDAERLYQMGLVYLEMGLYDQACESFETAALDEAFSVSAHEMWGIALQRANRLDEAIAVLTAGLAFAAAGSREHHGLHYHLGRAHEQAGQEELATECYRAIRAADPTFLDVGQRLKRLVNV